MDQMERNDIACNCILIYGIAFLVRTYLILIAFLMILIAYLRKYAAYLGCWCQNLGSLYLYFNCLNVWFLNNFMLLLTPSLPEI